jgi:hypothetical protein
MNRPESGLRLADIRVPRAWPIALPFAFVFARLYDRRQLRELERIGAELGTYVGQRDRAASDRETRMIKLTMILAWLTAALLIAAVATIVVTLAA